MKGFVLFFLLERNMCAYQDGDWLKIFFVLDGFGRCKNC